MSKFHDLIGERERREATLERARNDEGLVQIDARLAQLDEAVERPLTPDEHEERQGLLARRAVRVGAAERVVREARQSRDAVLGGLKVAAGEELAQATRKDRLRLRKLAAEFKADVVKKLRSPREGLESEAGVQISDAGTEIALEALRKVIGGLDAEPGADPDRVRTVIGKASVRSLLPPPPEFDVPPPPALKEPVEMQFVADDIMVRPASSMF